MEIMDTIWQTGHEESICCILHFPGKVKQPSKDAASKLGRSKCFMALTDNFISLKQVFYFYIMFYTLFYMI